MTERMTAGEFRLLPKVGVSKYRNQKVEFDGIKFDSKAEARFYAVLKQRFKIGEISALELQRRFKIFGPDGKLITTYRADFCFWDHVEDRFRCVDVKGVETYAFKIKKRMMMSHFGIDVEVVRT